MVRFLMALPVLVVLIAFALSNPDPVRIGMWPFETNVEVPLSVAVLTVAAVFFIFGALIVWVPGLGARARARRAERRLARLEAEMQAKPAAPVSGARAVAARR